MEEEGAGGREWGGKGGRDKNHDGDGGGAENGAGGKGGETEKGEGGAAEKRIRCGQEGARKRARARGCAEAPAAPRHEAGFSVFLELRT